MKKEKARSSKNLKINTRIVITTVTAIIVPLIIIGSLSPLLASYISTYYNLSSVTSSTFSTINQIQWSVTTSSITDTLIGPTGDKEKLNTIKNTVASIEKINSLVYIEKNNELYYSSVDSSDAIKMAQEIVSFDKEKNLNYFGENGLVIVNHANKGSDKYLLVIANDDYAVSDASEKLNAKEFSNLLFSRTGMIMLIIVMLFVLAIVIVSFITSRTIVNPIKKIAHGADEIARGNLDYEIDYVSTNELGQTVESFNAMRKNLKSSIVSKNNADTQRKQLIAGIAHDVRTPLTSAKGYAEGILDGIANTPEKQKYYLETILSSINDTEKILDELLTISRYDLKDYKLNFEDVKIFDFYSDGAEELKYELESKGFDFESNFNCSEDTIISLDTDAFARVIRNIIMNSVKYANDDVKGKIVMNINQYDKSVIVEIKDNGIGVDKKSLSKIFDPMFRADPARTKTSQGSGLGLAICKRIVELHNGFIWANSKEGEGLTIYISLPKKEVVQ